MESKIGSEIEESSGIEIESFGILPRGSEPVGQEIKCSKHGFQKVEVIDESVPQQTLYILSCGDIFLADTKCLREVKDKIDEISFYCEIRQGIDSEGKLRRAYLFGERNVTDEDFFVQADFEEIPGGGLVISYRNGPIETEEESNKNVQFMKMEDRKVVDAFKIFLNDDNEKRHKCSIKIYGHGCSEEGDNYVLFTFMFKRTSDGGLLLKRTAKWPETWAGAGFGSNNIEIRLHRSIVPAVKEVVNRNF